MDIEKQVCSLEQSKKLKELGIDQVNSIFNYSSGEDHEYELVLTSGYEWSDYPCWAGCKYQYSAFTVAELGVMLKTDRYLSVVDSLDGKICFSGLDMGELFELDPDDVYPKLMEGKMAFSTEAECRAAILIEFLEQGKISVSEVNERLAS